MKASGAMDVWFHAFLNLALEVNEWLIRITLTTNHDPSLVLPTTHSLYQQRYPGPKVLLRFK